MKKMLLLAVAALLAAAPANADTIDPLDPLHGMICSGAGTGCSNAADNGSFTPLSQTNNWGFSISPGPATGDLILAILVPTNSINIATFNIPSLTDNGGGPLASSVFSRTTLFNVGDGASLSAYLNLPNAGSYSPTDNFANASAGEATENPLFSGNFLAFTIALTGITLGDTSSTTIANDFSFGANLPAGTVIVGLFNELVDKKGDAVNQFIGTAASADLVITPFASETPLPAAAWLFGSALGGGAMLLRRRKKVRQP
jgi:hypothetical protein